jgi:predicted RNA-binding protein with PIN domain
MDSRYNKRHHQHTYISASDETPQREAQGRGASWAAAHTQSSEVIRSLHKSHQQHVIINTTFCYLKATSNIQ